MVLAEQNAAIAQYKGERANKKLKELFDNQQYSEIVQLYVPYPVYSIGKDLVDFWWKTWDIYWIFLLLRIFLVLFTQSGYVHPDEYFQTVEVITGDVLGIRTERTWEFNSTSPIRSVTFNMILFGGPLYLLKLADYVLNFPTGWTLIGPYLVKLVPRLVMLALSFISDYTVYQICLLYKHSYNQCLTTLASSYVMLVFSTRTFSNSVEMAMVSLLIYLVAHCLKRTSETLYLHAMVHENYVKAETPRDKAKIKKKEKLIPPHDFKFFLPISMLVAIGKFHFMKKSLIFFSKLISIYRNFQSTNICGLCRGSAILLVSTRSINAFNHVTFPNVQFPNGFTISWRIYNLLAFNLMRFSVFWSRDILENLGIVYGLE